MLKQFVGVWIVYWLAVAALPVHSLYPATLQAWLLQVVFVVLVAVSHLGVTALFGGRRAPHAARSVVPESMRMIRIALALSVVGLAALVYDKLIVQGIDYSDGVAVAREEWRRLGEDRDGSASSPFSALGYLLGNAYFVALVLAFTQVSGLDARRRLWTIAACFALLIANSALTGGRSSVLLLGAFAIAALGVRRGVKVNGLLRSRWHRTLLNALAATALAYTIYVFYERAHVGGESALGYALDFLPFLGIQADPGWRASLGDGALDSLQAMLVLGISYVAHSFATVAAIVEAPPEDKTIVFLHLFGILAKLGLGAAPDGDWFLTGRFPSLPGAFFHQFGGFGFAVCSVMLGAASGAAAAWTAKSPRSLLALGSATMAGVTLLLSPALLAADFLSFPFVAAAFLMVAALGRRPRRVGIARRLRPLGDRSALAEGTRS